VTEARAVVLFRGKGAPWTDTRRVRSAAVTSAETVLERHRGPSGARTVVVVDLVHEVQMKRRAASATQWAARVFLCVLRVTGSGRAQMLGLDEG